MVIVTSLCIGTYMCLHHLLLSTAFNENVEVKFEILLLISDT